MKKTIFLCSVIFLIGSQTAWDQEVPEKATPIPQHDLRLYNYAGQRIDLVFHNRIVGQDYEALVEPFRHKTETHLWQSEFWGKWMLGAVAAWEYTHDPVIMDHMKKAVESLIATQSPDGYIGNYAKESQLTNWDIWGRKYVMLGLLRYYEITGDRKALKAARKEADHLLDQVGPGKVNIINTGFYRGMASSSVLEPMVMLYNKTHQRKYLDFAEYIVRQWETPGGPQLISKALAGIHVADRFPHPKKWFSKENGQKAYEMMSCYDGLLGLYKVTGHPQYLKAVEMTVQDIIAEEINVAGSGTSFECWYHGREKQTLPTYHTMETCVAVTWMKLNYELFRITADPLYADQIEKTFYNALMASTRYNDAAITMYSPLLGYRQYVRSQCNMDITCCSANGPRGYMLIPRFAVMTGPHEIFINFYNQSSATVPLSSSQNVKIIQNTDYPVSGTVLITVSPERPEEFSLSLRVPSWSEENFLSVNGKKYKAPSPGTFAKITRTWEKGDTVILHLDMKGRLVRQNHHFALLRGPIVLARDSRFRDGFVDEAGTVFHKKDRVDLQPVTGKPEEMWMAFAVRMRMGTGVSATDGPPVVIRFCDFASAGNTWDPKTRYRVWIPEPLNVMNKEKIESY